MNNFKAGDFTSGKMNEIFRAAAEYFSDGAKINHKQLGDFSLIGDRMVETIYNEILRTNFGIFKSADDGLYKSCFNFIGYDLANIDSNDSCDAEYLLAHHKDEPDAMVISYEVLHCFGGSIRNYSFVDMVTLLTYKQARKDEQWSLSVDVDNSLANKLVLSESVMNKKQHVNSLAGKFEECMTWCFSGLVDNVGNNAFPVDYFKSILIKEIPDLLDGGFKVDAEANFDLLFDYTINSKNYFLGVSDGNVTFKTFSA